MAKSQREVLDEEFSSFEKGLSFSCATYKIKKSRLSHLYFDNGESFDRAVEGFHRLVSNIQQLICIIKILINDDRRVYL